MDNTKNSLRTTDRLLLRETQRRGWKVEIFWSGLRSSQAVLRAEKDGKEFIYSSTLTSLTPAYGCVIAGDKYLTYELLKSGNISTPDTAMISGESDDFSEVEAFLEGHKCVIVKPACANHGNGITMDITNKEQLVRAVGVARKAAVDSGSSAVLVQERVEGGEYHFLVVDGKCIAVANCCNGEVVNCTSIASFELKKLAKDAAARCRLGIAGVDIITTNIHGGGKNYVIEVNSRPDIHMYMRPSVGRPINAAKYIVDALERYATPITHAHRCIIGRSEYVESSLFGEGVKVPARIDTGARTASIWASDISMSKDGKLHFCLFDKQSEFYTGKIHETTDYMISVVRSSTGQEEMRFRVKIPIMLARKKILASFNLSDRSINSYPILIGRNVINKKFTIDVAQYKCQNDGKNDRVVSRENSEKLVSNPYEFYRKHTDVIVGIKKQKIKT